MDAIASRARSVSVAEAALDELRVEVTGILDELADTIDVQLEFPLAPVVLGDQEHKPVGPARLDVVLTYAGSGIVASGTVAVDFNLKCSRCLADFVLPIVADVEGFYVRPGVEAEVPEEQEAQPIVSRHIDLMPAISSAIALAMPFAPLHDPDCAGICVTCGSDLAEGPCGCEKDLSLSPFAALKDFVPAEDDDS